MEFIRSQRGTAKLCYEGFTYTKKKETKSTMRWECSQRRSENCKGTATTDNPPTRVITSTDHGHVNDKFYVEALKVREEITAAVISNWGQPHRILADKLVHHPVEVRVAAGITENIKRNMRAKKAGQTPKNPEQLEDIPIPFPEAYWTKLIYDNESTPSRMLVFAS
ncbi:uncharacterized protein LOC127860080 isoform X2 [Dreissena polymorpha]|uniref:uncharacterized protein LOC127860080 isoform X1 n=2 Tax=Dreissena polymorpha TaxID=45954 RepID=UPI002265576E|nr:uncharacterized protein LOC127860080 isoform X1 [Dreissena polymorpha]XP_052253830.1 uncharacterized protein LOC127860080 isoform X2 [Dreissena polymorpha]